jgi:hypothetical protein
MLCDAKTGEGPCYPALPNSTCACFPAPTYSYVQDTCHPLYITHVAHAKVVGWGAPTAALLQHDFNVFLMLCDAEAGEGPSQAARVVAAALNGIC